MNGEKPTKDIRWLQRFEHYRAALRQLQKFIDKNKAVGLNELELQGLIQAFEYTYELAWTTIKDYYEHQGESGISGSRDAFRLAFRRGLLEDGDVWMKMIQSRILTVHTYNEDTAEAISRDIFDSYFPAFRALEKKLQELAGRI